MPNRPITAIREVEALEQFGHAEGHAQLAGDRVHADGGEREAGIIAAIVFPAAPCSYPRSC